MADISNSSKEEETLELKRRLKAFDFDDDAMTREEMRDLLKALENSQTSANIEEEHRKKVVGSAPDVEKTVPKRVIKGMERRYADVADRRMPWSILPPDLTPMQKAAALAAYITFLAKDRYIQARSSTTFIQWPQHISLAPEISRVQPVRSTRSGRTVVATYVDSDDDLFEVKECNSKKNIRKRKASESSPTHSSYTNKTISLKRKQKVDGDADDDVRNGSIDPSKKLEPSHSNKKEKVTLISDSPDEILLEVLADNENIEKSPTLPSSSKQKKKFFK